MSHISDLLEGIFLVWYYYELTKKSKFALLALLVPPLYFFLEIKFSGSINNMNGISFSVYNAFFSFLMLSILLKLERINEFSKPIVKALFIIHSVSFIYSILEHVIRMNIDLMQIVYPVFLFSQVVFNVFISYYLWSVRKS
jgi:hypothetical protein